MEDTASHETAYKLAHRADKANFSRIVLLGHLLADCSVFQIGSSYLNEGKVL